MKQATRSRRHLPAYRRRLQSIFGVIMDGVGLAVLLFMAYAFISLLNDYINGV
jgi:hypothetical protein